LVKLLNPVAGPSLQVASYTHPEYAISMQETLQRMHAHAMLLRGTEGEPVADPRKTPSMRCMVRGEMSPEFQIEADVQHQTVDLPTGMDTQQSRQFMDDLLSGKLAIPPSLLVQIDVINRLSLACTQVSSKSKPK
jgi:anthranilate phosphoribosyltransferase